MPPLPRLTNPTLSWWFVLGACAIALTIVIPQYQATGFWVDEVFMAFMSGTGRYSPVDVQTVLERVREDRAWPPLSYVLLWAWGHVAGGSEFSGRYLSALFGLLSIAVVYQLGRALGRWDKLDGHLIGLTAALALLGASFYLYYWQEMRGYTLALFTTAVALWQYVRIVQQRQSSFAQYVWFAAFVSLTLYTHYTFSAILGALGLYHLLAMRKHPAYSKVLLAFAVAVLSFGPWIPALRYAVHQEINITRPGETFTLLLDTLRAFGSGNLAVFAVFFGLALWGGRSRSGRFMLVISVLTGVLLVGFQVLTGFYFHPRHILMLFLPFAVLIGLAIAHLFVDRPRLAVVALSVWVTFGFAQSIHFDYYMNIQTSVRRISSAMAVLPQRWLEADNRPDGVVLYVAAPDDEWIEYVTTAHYFRRLDAAYLHNMLNLTTVSLVELRSPPSEANDEYIARIEAFLENRPTLAYLRLNDLPVSAHEVAFLQQLARLQFETTRVDTYEAFSAIYFTLSDNEP